jgi:glutamyl-tRNA reductase
MPTIFLVLAIIKALRRPIKFKIDQVWLGWTEDKDDPEVREIYSAVRDVPTQVLEKALEELRKTGSHSYEAIKKVAQFLKNNGMDDAKEIAQAQDAGRSI